MQRTILASVIIMSLSACDSDSLTLSTTDDAVNNAVNTVVASDSTVIDANNGTTDTGTTVVANNGTTTNGGTTVVVQTPISDDAGSSTSDGVLTLLLIQPSKILKMLPHQSVMMQVAALLMAARI